MFKDEHYKLIGILIKRATFFGIKFTEKRKRIKLMIKTITREVMNNYDTFNSFVGKENIIYIHARIGGGNWDSCGGDNIARQPWFICKVDDAFDTTYRDIYGRLPNDTDITYMKN